MNYSGSCEVTESLTQRGKEISGATHCSQPTIWPPCPMTNYRIDKSCYADTIKYITSESCSTNHCSGRYGRACICESKLEDPVSNYGYSCCFIRVRGTRKKEPVIANETVTMTKH